MPAQRKEMKMAMQAGRQATGRLKLAGNGLMLEEKDMHQVQINVDDLTVVQLQPVGTFACLCICCVQRLRRGPRKANCNAAMQAHTQPD